MVVAAGEPQFGSRFRFKPPALPAREGLPRPASDLLRTMPDGTRGARDSVLRAVYAVLMDGRRHELIAALVTACRVRLRGLDGREET